MAHVLAAKKEEQNHSDTTRFPEAAEIDRHWRRYWNRPTEENRNKIVMLYSPYICGLAVGIKNKYTCRPTVEDLANEGVLAMLPMVANYDPKFGLFTSYAFRRVTGAMKELIRRTDTFPRLQRDRRIAMGKLRQQMTASLGRRVSDDELAKAMGKTFKQFNRIHVTDQTRVSRLPEGRRGHRRIDQAVASQSRLQMKPSAAVEHSDFAETMIGSLPCELRIISRMLFVEKLRFQDVVCQTGIARSTLVARSRLARQLLRERVEADYPELIV